MSGVGDQIDQIAMNVTELLVDGLAEPGMPRDERLAKATTALCMIAMCLGRVVQRLDEHTEASAGLPGVPATPAGTPALGDSWWLQIFEELPHGQLGKRVAAMVMGNGVEQTFYFPATADTLVAESKGYRFRVTPAQDEPWSLGPLS